MKRLTIREFRAALPTLDEEVEIVKFKETIGYFIPKSMVKDTKPRFLKWSEVRRVRE